MADVNALTYLNLQDAVLGRRFPASTQRANSKRWLASAYQDVWGAFDWPFRRVPRATFNVTGGQSNQTAPTDFADVIRIQDNYGISLERFSEEDFEDIYGPVLLGLATATGIPQAFTVVNRTIYLAPVPSGSLSYTLTYRRRLSSRTNALAVQAGMMSADTDYPLWDDHHAILIPRAQAIGLQELSDPTWQGAQQEYERQLDQMKDDYRPEPPVEQWGADRWDA